MKRTFMLTYASAPSCTQMTEAAVKFGNHCRGPNRSEEVRSQFAIVCHTIVALASAHALGNHVSRVRNDRQKPVTLRCAMRSKTSSGCYFNTANQMIDNSCDEKTLNRYILTLSDSEKNSYKIERNKNAIQAFKTSTDENSTPPSLSQEHPMDPDITPLILGRILYSKLRKQEHLEAIINELTARNVPIPSTHKIRPLIKLLQAHEKDNKSFQPITGASNFD